mgnify:FL=1
MLICADICRLVTGCYPDCYGLLPLLPVVTYCPGTKKPLRDGAASSGTHVGRLLVPSFFITRFSQQGGDEVAETLVCKYEFQDTECPFQSGFHSGITF